MALGRAQRRMSGIRQRRVLVSGVRRRQRHRRRVANRAGCQRPSGVDPPLRRRSPRRRKRVRNSERQPVREDRRRPPRNLGVRPAPTVEIQLRPADRRIVGRRNRAGFVGVGAENRARRQLRLERYRRNASLSARSQKRPHADPQTDSRASPFRLSFDHRRICLSRIKA